MNWKRIQYGNALNAATLCQQVNKTNNTIMIISHGVCSIEILEMSDSRRGIYVWMVCVNLFIMETLFGLVDRNMNLLSTYMDRYGWNSKNSEHNTWTSPNTNVIDHLVF